MTDILIALGTNETIGSIDLASVVRDAIRILDSIDNISVDRASRLYDTPAWPPGSGPDFVNAAACLTSRLPTQQILQILHRVESQFGRTRRLRWGVRTLDLDLLGRSGEVSPDRRTVQTWMALSQGQAGAEAPDELLLPHPRLHERAFVLVPLQDVAPSWRHPILDKTVTEMLADLPPEEVDAVRIRPG